ncbi:MAG: TetR/AcrR family transcriptional regulator [Ignavibacteriaceae bacterium]
MEKERKLQIIKAADKRFAKHGLNKTTLDEIARDLRIGKATIYHYFKSKDELFYAALDLEADQLLDDIKNIFMDKDRDLNILFAEYLNCKETVHQKYRLIYETLLNLLKENVFEQDIKFVKNLFGKEEELLNSVLIDIPLEKKETTNTSLGLFWVNQSWGLLFTDKISQITGNEKHQFTKEILLGALESFSGKK